MGTLNDIYRPPLALLTDLDQLTMATGYWKTGRAEQPPCFTCSFARILSLAGIRLLPDCSMRWITCLISDSPKTSRVSCGIDWQ